MPKDDSQFTGWGVGVSHATKPISFLPTPEMEQVLRALPNRSAQIREWVLEGIVKLGSLPRGKRPHPETDLQTLSALNPKECSFVANGKLQSGAIAAVLVDWKTGKVSAVLINTADSQVQVPIAKVTILPD